MVGTNVEASMNSLCYYQNIFLKLFYTSFSTGNNFSDVKERKNNQSIIIYIVFVAQIWWASALSSIIINYGMYNYFDEEDIVLFHEMIS